MATLQIMFVYHHVVNERPRVSLPDHGRAVVQAFVPGALVREQVVAFGMGRANLPMCLRTFSATTVGVARSTTDVVRSPCSDGKEQQ
jgi:hypothetical protein